MDFKYTPARSLDQQGDLACVHGLILQWIEIDVAHDPVLMKKVLADIKTY